MNCFLYSTRNLLADLLLVGAQTFRAFDNFLTSIAVEITARPQIKFCGPRFVGSTPWVSDFRGKRETEDANA